MISRLKGTIIFKTNNKIELAVGGLGYEVYFSPKDITEVLPDGEIEIFTYHHVAEDKNELYGFLKREDKQVFELLLSVSGIGPKTALNIFTVGGGEEILAAITKADVDFFRQVKGLGQKGAQRIIVDLKNKVGAVVDLDFSMVEGGNDLYQVLFGLGFTRGEIAPILGKIPDDLKTENEKIKWALKLLGRANR